MRYRIQSGPDEHTATVTPEGSTFRVDVLGQAFQVADLESGAGRKVLLVGNRVVRVDLGKPPRVDGRFVAVTVEPDNGAAASRASRRAHGGSLESPMPGRVLRVRVSVGDRVTSDTVVLVIEAMKMENQLFAPCAGRVEAVLVGAGDTVEAQAELLRVTAEPDG